MAGAGPADAPVPAGPEGAGPADAPLPAEPDGAGGPVQAS
jgi:hypothetical protein